MGHKALFAGSLWNRLSLRETLNPACATKISSFLTIGGLQDRQFASRSSVYTESHRKKLRLLATNELDGRLMVQVFSRESPQNNFLGLRMISSRLSIGPSYRVTQLGFNSHVSSGDRPYTGTLSAFLHSNRAKLG